MSISKVNKIFQNKGCNIAVSVILGFSVAAMLVPSVRGCGSSSEQEQQAMAARLGSPVVSIGDQKIYSKLIDDAYDGMLQQQIQSQQPQMQDFLRNYYENQPAAVKASMRLEALDQMIKQHLMLELASQKQLDLSEDSIKKTALEAAKESARNSLISTGKLKPTASEKEFEDALQKESKQDYASMVKTLNDSLSTALSDPARADAVKAQMAGLLLQRQYAAKIAVTDDELKNSYRTLKLKRISFAPGPDATAKANAVLKELSAGLSFEAAMEKYSIDPAPSKEKKKSDSTTSLQVSNIEEDPNLKALVALKPGEVSQVVEGPGGPAIYKLVSVDPNLPKDFEAQKASLKQQYASAKASKQLSDELEALQKKQELKWESAGWKAAYDYAQLAKAGKPDSSKVKDIIDECLKAAAVPADPGSDIAAATAYQAFQGEYRPADVKGNKDLLKRQAEILSAYTEHYPELQAMISLAETYLDLKQKDDFLGAVVNAARTNVAHVDDEGERNWVQINGLVGKAENAGLVKADEVADVHKQFTSWQKDREEDRKAQAARAAQEKLDEEERKKDAAAKEKAEAEAKKPIIRKSDSDNKAGITPLPGDTPPKK